jgi:hypothetical protein
MPKISLSGPADLLTIIPFQLGFQPTQSVVVVCFHGKRLGLVARVDAVDHPVAAVSAAQLLPTVLESSPSSVAVVGFETEPDESLPVLEEVVTGLEQAQVIVRERLVVRDGRWRSLGCDCCPDAGWLPLPQQSDVPAVASFVALGHSVLPDRAGLARLVEPLDSGHPRHALTTAAIDDWQRRYAEAGGSVSDAAHTAQSRRTAQRRMSADGGLGVLDGGELSARQFLVNHALVAWGGVLHGEIQGYGLEHWLPALVGPLRDIEVRDALVGWLCHGSVAPDSLPDDLAAMLEVFLGPDLRVPSSAGGVADLSGDHECADDGWEAWDQAAAPRLLLSRLEEVCRMTPAAHAAPVLSVMASFAWWCGDGARAGIAADRALDLEPDNRLSLLVRGSLDHGIRPPRCA